MNNEVRVFHDRALSSRELVEHFQDLIYEEGDEEGGPTGLFASALDLEVDHYDDRAFLDSVEVTDVVCQGVTIEVEYKVTYSAFHGCSDMNYTRQEDRHVVGALDGRDWVFDTFIYPQRQAPNEEL